MGVVDGVYFRMRKTGVAVDDPLAYCVYPKSEYALLAIALCDACCRYLFWSFDCQPTVHDSVAWSQCELGMKVANGELPSEYFLNGDAAQRERPDGDPVRRPWVDRLRLRAVF